MQNQQYLFIKQVAASYFRQSISKAGHTYLECRLRSAFSVGAQLSSLVRMFDIGPCYSISVGSWLYTGAYRYNKEQSRVSVKVISSATIISIFQQGVYLGWMNLEIVIMLHNALKIVLRLLLIIMSIVGLFVRPFLIFYGHVYIKRIKLPPLKNALLEIPAVDLAKKIRTREV